MANYFYGKLSNSVEKVEYNGATTSTAVVTINNTNNTISVDVKPLSPDILNIKKPSEQGNYILQETIDEKGNTSYAWVLKETFTGTIQTVLDEEIARAKEAEAAIAGGVNQEIADRKNADDKLKSEIDITNGRIDELSTKYDNLSTRQDNLNQDIGNVEANLAQEAEDRKTQYTEFHDEFEKHIEIVKYIESVNRDRYNKLNDDLDTLKNSSNEALEKEKEERTAADDDLFSNLQNESFAREQADNELQQNLNIEITTRNEADSALDTRITVIENTGVLNSQIEGTGKLKTTVQSTAGRTFDVDVVDISDADHNDRFTVTLNNDDSISGSKTDGTSLPLVFMSKWDKV